MASALALILMMAGCSGDSSEEAEAPEDTQPVEVEDSTSEQPVGDESAHRFVQDLWVYERVTTIDVEGDEIDLTNAIVDGLEGPADRQVELTDDVVFHVYESLAARITDARGTEREDLDVVGGLIEHDGDRALSVLATPHLDAPASVRFGDQVKFDLTYLEGLIEPGDPLLYDFAFLQAYPHGDDASHADLTGLELLAARMEMEEVGYFGEVDDAGETHVLLYTGQLGEAVEGSIEGGAAGKSNDMRTGMVKGTTRCGFALRCVSNFFRKFGDGAESSWDQAWDNGGPPRDPINEPRHPTCRGSNCSRSWGEPHLMTFDGVSYDMQAVGEFIAMAGPDFEVQLRTRPYQDRDTISIGTAVAVGFDEHRLTVDIEAERDEIVRLDGEAVGLDELRAEPRSLGDARVTLMGDALQVEFGDDLVTIANLEGRGFIDLYLDLAAESVDTRGLLGSANGDPSDDFTTRGADVLDQPIAHDDLYGRFVESWRIAPEESLFDYAPGTDTDFFTDRSFPSASITVADLDAGARKRAEAVCRAAGIEHDQVLQSCIFDYVLTGDVSFVRSAAAAEVAQLIVDGDLDPRALPIGGDGRRPVDSELTVAPYEPGPNEVVWLFSSEAGAPEQVPTGVEATPVRNPNDLPIYELTDQYGYPTDPILRVAPLEGATTLEEAIELGSYVEFDLTPTSGPFQITRIQMAAGRGRSGETKRGFDIRSSADDYRRSLLAAEIEFTRPDMERFAAAGVRQPVSGPTTFRIYLYTGGTTQTVEIGDLAITIAR